MTILRRTLAVSKRNFRVCISSFAQSLSVGNTHGDRERYSDLKRIPRLIVIGEIAWQG
jgi:hypothetical protein